MADLVGTEIQDGVAVIIVDHPPVNALSQEVVDGPCVCNFGRPAR